MRAVVVEELLSIVIFFQQRFMVHESWFKIGVKTSNKILNIRVGGRILNLRVRSKTSFIATIGFVVQSKNEKLIY